MNKLAYNILALLNLRVKHPDSWDSIHSCEDMTTLYACKDCYKIINGSPGCIKKMNNHICHSLNIPLAGYISKKDIAINEKVWQEMKAKIECKKGGKGQ